MDLDTIVRIAQAVAKRFGLPYDPIVPRGANWGRTINIAPGPVGPQGEGGTLINVTLDLPAPMVFVLEEITVPAAGGLFTIRYGSGTATRTVPNLPAGFYPASGLMFSAAAQTIGGQAWTARGFLAPDAGSILT